MTGSSIAHHLREDPAGADPPPTPPPSVPSQVAGAPVPITPVAGAGPPVLSNIPAPGGGGGGIFTPPVVVSATPEVPPTAVTPVPEPATWAMMIFGFALIGRALRRRPVPVAT